MATIPKVMNGARAVLSVINPNTGAAGPVGIFSSVSYSLQYAAQPVFILGRYSAAEIDYTGAEPISVTASGWRVIGNGPHVAGGVARLQDLLQHDELTLVITDRATNAPIAKVTRVRPTGFSTTIDSRNLEQITVTFIGIVVDDESTQNSESAGATNLP